MGMTLQRFLRLGQKLKPMLTTLAIANCRSLLQLVLPLGARHVIPGRNVSGKSNLYRWLRLSAETVQGGVVNAPAG